MPKGVQEKRTEVLENKVDRILVSNAFFLMNEKNITTHLSHIRTSLPCSHVLKANDLDV